MAFPYKRILCPTDFDGNAGLALDEAKELALRGGGTVYVLHVIQVNPLATEGYVLGELYESQIKEARDKLVEIARHHLSGPDHRIVEHQILVEVGEPGDVILGMAQRLGTDLVVMATHGRRGLTRLVLGSVAERVVRESVSPVLTVRPHPGD